MSSRDKHRAPNVRHIIYNHSRIYSCPPEINTVSVMFDISSMLTVVYDCFFHGSMPYHIVRHIIHNHISLCLCFPELNTVSLLFDTWSKINIVYGRVFQSCIPSLLFDIPSMTFLFLCLCLPSSIVCHCSMFHLWSPLLMFMSSRDNITSLMFDVSSMIIAIHACVFRRSNMVFLMFDTSPMVIFLYASVYERYIPCP